MPPILLIGRLSTPNKASRDKVIAGLSKIADYAKKHDPDTTKHATHLSCDPNDETTVWAIEEYKSQEACDKHNTWPPVLEFLEFCKAEPDVLSGAPDVWHSEQIELFARPRLAENESPFVILTRLTYDTTKLDSGLGGWKSIVRHMESSEQGMLASSVGKAVEYENTLTVVEVYDDEHTFQSIHMQEGQVHQVLQKDKSIRAAQPEVAFLKQVAGFWA